MGIQENGEQRFPKLGSEVRFRDGASAGKIRALNSEGFLVVRGKKRMRRLVFPYSSIANVGNRVVTLRDMKATGPGKNQSESNENESLSKKRLVKEVQQRLGLNNFERTERIVRITLHLMSMRLSDEQKKRFKKALPPGIRSLWHSNQSGFDHSFSISDFLTLIRKQGRFQSMEEAFVAAREVFTSVKTMIPSVQMMEISHTLPRGLQEIWDVA